MNSRTLLAVLAALGTACGGPAPRAPAPAQPVASVAAPSAVASAPTLADPLGPVPVVTLASPFQPPAPLVYTTPNGLTVWLLERHALPVVAATIVVPTGSSSDPKGEAGLVDQATQMLLEGAGKRGALEFARAVDDLGAKLDVGVSRDSSHVHLGVLERSFAAGMELLGDVVVRPRWDGSEWKRVHDLWLNDLKERASDPEAVAHVVEMAVLYGSEHPDGHPVEGLVRSAPRVQLVDARRSWTQTWRPDRATIIVVGDVSRAELDPQLDAAFGAWKSPATPSLPVVTPPPPPSAVDRRKSGPGPRIVLVDRPDAPQAVLRVIRAGVAAADLRYPPLYRANIALGGSFTSRLNHDLREEKGWTYGATSWVMAARGVGAVSAGGAFVLDKSVDALKAMLADVDEMAHAGMSEEEAGKTRMQARSEIVGEYQTVDRTSLALAHDAALGLGPDYEARSSVLSDQAQRADLNQLAATFFDRSGAIVVAVGPRAKLEAALTQAGFQSFEYRDAEGAVVAHAAK